MALAKVLGYNIVLDLNGNKIAGTTSETFSLTPVTEETKMKSDLGVAQLDILGHEGKFSVNAYVVKSADAGVMDVAEVMDACMDNDSSTFTYSFGVASGSCTVTGTAQFISFTINSDSEGYANMTIELQTVGEVTISHVL